MRAGLSLSIRIRHPSIAPELVSSRMKVKPTASHAVGSPRKTPSGKLLGGNYAETHWVFRLVDRDDTELGKAIELANEWLTIRTEHVEAIVNSGGAVELYITVSSPGTLAAELPAELLIRCAALRLSISVEVLRS